MSEYDRPQIDSWEEDPAPRQRPLLSDWFAWALIAVCFGYLFGRILVSVALGV